MRASADIRLAVDIGGTFTDLVAVNAVTSEVTRAKADTTRGRLERGVLTALERSGLEPGGVASFIHGTTVVINAVTERSGVPTALVTTEGFRDVLEIGRANRPDIYNLAYRKPEPFVPRRLRFEVRERMSYQGEVIEPLDAAGLDAVAAALAGAGIRAVAVCFLHAWANPAHELAAARLLAERLPGVAVVASHQVSGQWREYERTSTAVLSAYVQPVVATYLRSLEASLRGAGIGGPMRVMRSNGGVASFGRAEAAPIGLLESGPVAGVTAAAQLGRRLGARHVLTLDIGGTTAKTAAVRDGEVRVETLHHIGRTPVFPGYPVQAPTVEIVEIGAGGGSIVWADAAGGLHVGPRSAGAEPGPACYGRGGTEPTLTDANLVVGRLDPGYFLGGAMRLDPDAARRAFGGLGAALGTDAAGVARGVLRYAIAQMSHALRLVTLRRGHDPREFAFVAFGGAGPLHAAFLARELGIRQTIIPPGPGHFSAFGMLAGDLRADAVRTIVGPLAETGLAAALGAAAAAARAELGDQADGAVIRGYAELRYQGQEHTLEIPLPDSMVPAGLITARSEGGASGAAGGAVITARGAGAGDGDGDGGGAGGTTGSDEGVITARGAGGGPGGSAAGSGGPPSPAQLKELAAAFGRRCQEAYAFRLDAPLEVVSIRVSVTAPGGGDVAWAGDDGDAGLDFDARPVDFDQHGGVVTTPVLSRAALAAGTAVPGPCVITEPAATTIVLPGQTVRRDDLGNLVIEEG